MGVMGEKVLRDQVSWDQQATLVLVSLAGQGWERRCNGGVCQARLPPGVHQQWVAEWCHVDSDQRKTRPILFYDTIKPGEMLRTLVNALLVLQREI